MFYILEAPLRAEKEEEPALGGHRLPLIQDTSCPGGTDTVSQAPASQDQEMENAKSGLELRSQFWKPVGNGGGRGTSLQKGNSMPPLSGDCRPTAKRLVFRVWAFLRHPWSGHYLFENMGASHIRQAAVSPSH